MRALVQEPTVISLAQHQDGRRSVDMTAFSQDGILHGFDRPQDKIARRLMLMSQYNWMPNPAEVTDFAKQKRYGIR
jgi:hypothetical protein